MSSDMICGLGERFESVISEEMARWRVHGRPEDG